MSCLISAGITRDCGYNFGGLQLVYLANATEVTAVSKDADNQITGITMATGATFYEFQFEPETGQKLEELQAGNVSKFILQTLNFQLANITQAKKEVLEDLGVSDLVCIMQTQDDLYWYFGELGRGLKPTTLNIDSGTADADDAVATVALAGGNRGYANTVDSSIIAGLL